MQVNREKAARDLAQRWMDYHNQLVKEVTGLPNLLPPPPHTCFLSAILTPSVYT